MSIAGKKAADILSATKALRPVPIASPRSPRRRRDGFPATPPVDGTTGRDNRTGSGFGQPDGVWLWGLGSSGEHIPFSCSLPVCAHALRATGRQGLSDCPTVTFRTRFRTLLPLALPSLRIHRCGARLAQRTENRVMARGPVAQRVNSPKARTGSGFGVWGEAIHASIFPSAARSCCPQRTPPAGRAGLPEPQRRFKSRFYTLRPLALLSMRIHRCDARLAQGLSGRSVHKLPRTADTNATVRLERQEVLVTRDDDVGLRRQRHRCARTGRSFPGTGRRGRCDR